MKQTNKQKKTFFFKLPLIIHYEYIIDGYFNYRINEFVFRNFQGYEVF